MKNKISEEAKEMKIMMIKRGLSLKDVANAVGLSQSYTSQIITGSKGMRKEGSGQSRKRVLKFFGMDKE